MATATDFPETNFTWGSNGPDVDDLKAYVSVDAAGIVETISCWTLTKEELFEIVHTGQVWLTVRGAHPAVSVEGRSPFHGKEYDG